MSLSQLERRAFYLESKYQKYLSHPKFYHKFIGKGSPVALLHVELNDLWKEINRLTRVVKGFNP